MGISDGVNPKPQNDSIKEDVLKAIHDGQVKMRPKWQFSTKATLMVFGMVLIAFTVLFLVSFIVFVLRQTGVLFEPGFGFSNLGVFFMSLPWVMILLAAVFMLLLEMIIKKYPFAYARPFLYSSLAVIFLGIIGGIIIGETPLHQRFFDEAENGQLPFAGPIYQHYGEQPQNVTVGTITQINSNGYQILLYGDEDDIFSVVVGPQTQVPPPGSLKEGDIIVILGPRQGSIIVASAIQRPFNLPPPGRRAVVPGNGE